MHGGWAGREGRSAPRQDAAASTETRNDPTLKVLVFTEFVSTQEMLREFLRLRGFSVTFLNGSMDMEERRRVQHEFAGEVRVLVSTDAGGEGLNLQFCHVAVNYDLPWNPMRIEQRIGRVDRIGQKKIVRAFNLVLEGSVEHRVREVLESKLQTILKEFGVDKAGDVLDSAEADQSFDNVYVGAILDPTQIAQKVDTLLSLVRARARAAREGAGLLTTTQDVDPRVARSVLDHPLPNWVERMTLAYLEAMGGKAERDLLAWNITWPDGAAMRGAVFHQREAEITGAQLLSLEDARVRGLASNLPRAAQGQPIPILRLSDLSAEVRGVWSLWRVSLCADDERRVRVLPAFRHDDGRALAPTARHLWDRLLGAERIDIVGRLEGREAETAYEHSLSLAKKLGQDLFRDLLYQHRHRLECDREKTEFALSRRREAIRRIGLPAVRHHRMGGARTRSRSAPCSSRKARARRSRAGCDRVRARGECAMSGWRDHILAHFAPQTSLLTLVADPDGLLIEEGIVNAIHARGFNLIPFDDPVAFRFAYESQYRQRWDSGETTDSLSSFARTRMTCAICPSTCSRRVADCPRSDCRTFSPSSPILSYRRSIVPFSMRSTRRTGATTAASSETAVRRISC